MEKRYVGDPVREIGQTFAPTLISACDLSTPEVPSRSLPHARA